MDNYLDKTLTPARRAKSLLQRMTIEQKIAQLQCCMVNSSDLNECISNGIGEVSFLFCPQELDEIYETAVDVQKKVMNCTEFGIPAIFHIEALSGGMIKGATSFPAPIGLGATWKPEIVENMAGVIKEQLSALGIRHALAPVMDIARDSRWGRSGECYSEDPTLTSSMSVAYVKGIQGKALTEGVLATGKHFLGYSYAQGGINTAVNDLTPRTMREAYAKPFQAAIHEADLATIMNSYGSIDNEPIAASESILRDLLKGEMGFAGSVVSDYMSIEWLHDRYKTSSNYHEAGVQAIKAGIDMEFPTQVCFTSELINDIAEDRLSVDILNDAVFRVLKNKFALGLFENPFPSKEKMEKVFQNKYYEKDSLQAAKDSIVLLKNNGILPLSKNLKKIALIGPHGNSVRLLFGCGSYPALVETLGIQDEIMHQSNSTGNTGKRSEKIDSIYREAEIERKIRTAIPEAKSIFDQLCTFCPETIVTYSRGFGYSGEEQNGFAAALEVAASADVAIVTVGGKSGWCNDATMGEGRDATNINLPAAQEEFLKCLESIDVPVVLIHLDGRPISSDQAEKCADGIIEAWLPGTHGAEAICSILFGEYNPGGKMPVSVPYNSGQIPVYLMHNNGSSYGDNEIKALSQRKYVDVPYTPRYYFGYGLSYSCFEFSDFTIEKLVVSAADIQKASVIIKNVGGVKGDEVVQCYIVDKFASMVRPVKELIGFTRVSLDAGEMKKITFTFRVSQLAFLNKEMKWIVESGDMKLVIGNSSIDERCCGEFEVFDTVVVDCKNRGFYADIEISEV